MHSQAPHYGAALPEGESIGVRLPLLAAMMLTSFVALLNVAGPCLYRRALTSVVEAVTGATPLLNPIATCGRAGGPLRPGRPAIVSRVAGCEEK